MVILSTFSIEGSHYCKSNPYLSNGIVFFDEVVECTYPLSLSISLNIAGRTDVFGHTQTCILCHVFDENSRTSVGNLPYSCTEIPFQMFEEGVSDVFCCLNNKQNFRRYVRDGR